MTDRQEPAEGTGNQDIQTLLRQMTSEDAVLVAPPFDLWDRIEAEAGVADDQTKVVPLNGRRRFSLRTPVLTAVAAATVAIVGGIAVVTQRAEAGPMVMANAELAYDPANFDELGAGAAAQVSLIDEEGMLRVEITESDLPRPLESADLELWLIEPDADGKPKALVSLGLVEPDTLDDFEVPADFDPDVYFVVDISVEPRDGNADHSGRSILRGPLTKS